ncbi:SELENOF [Branchiostoma lanceolatum]|uniref:SELENOF protein n=1 Tax=Branchiostoma lanceolatum TaxID=7740 RepID=A0A8K0EWB3_BRALA|nr:SELENOF [Branchiostoma lanceolatum]
MAPASYFLWMVLLFLVTLVTCEFTSEKCQDLGFTTNLLCSSCDELKQFQLQSLEDNCRQCCQQDNPGSTQQLFPGALLEVCG